jgi:hypothetical protein
VDLEPVYALYADVPYPLDAATAHRRGLEEAAMCFSAMIYGWAFQYDIGEKARGIAEELELSPQGVIPWGDPGLSVTDVKVLDRSFFLWADYRLDEVQRRRMAMWKAGTIRTAQATGHGPLGGPADPADWLAYKKESLEDAARAAIRAMLRGSERNRPKEVRGFISLTAFPTYGMDAGQWTASCRFRVEITEIQPFAVY